MTHKEKDMQIAKIYNETSEAERELQKGNHNQAYKLISSANFRMWYMFMTRNMRNLTGKVKGNI